MRASQIAVEVSRYGTRNASKKLYNDVLFSRRVRCTSSERTQTGGVDKNVAGVR